MGEPTAATQDDFLAFYDAALPYVYGYLSARCGPRSLAEDLTAETFLAAVDAFRRDEPPSLSTAWAMGVARNKLVDHWRRQARTERGFRLLIEPAEESSEPWDEQLDTMRVREVLEGLSSQHRAVLTLRYLDDLSVPEVAGLMGRNLHATEALLVRARASFRRCYAPEETPDD